MEMGKPIKQSYAEIDKCIAHIDYYLKNTEHFLEEEKFNTKF